MYYVKRNVISMPFSKVMERYRGTSLDLSPLVSGSGLWTSHVLFSSPYPPTYLRWERMISVNWIWTFPLPSKDREAAVGHASSLTANTKAGLRTLFPLFTWLKFCHNIYAVWGQGFIYNRLCWTISKCWLFVSLCWKHTSFFSKIH